MTYAEKLRDPRWQKKRLEIMQRDGWACCSCKRTDLNLQVHHLIYMRRDPWDYPDHLYQTLCEACHDERQGITDSICNALRISIAKTPTSKLKQSAQVILDRAMLEIELEGGK